MELFNLSHRGQLNPEQAKEVFSKGLLHFNHLFRLFSPDFFGHPGKGDLTIGYIESSGYFGIVPLFFALVAFIKLRKNKLVLFFSSVFILSTLFSLQHIGSLLENLRIPVITSGSGLRIFGITLFTGSILAGFGVDYFMKFSTKRKVLSISIFSLIFILTIVVTVFTGQQENVRGFINNIMFSLMILACFVIGTIIYLVAKKRLYKKIVSLLFIIFIIGITFFDLFRLGYRFLTFSNEKFLYPELEVTTFVRKYSESNLSRVFGLTEPELGTYLQIHTAETYNPLYLTKTAQLLNALQGIDPQQLTSDNKYFLTAKGEDLKFALDFIGTQIIVTRKEENPSIRYFETDEFSSEFNKIYEDEVFAVYENAPALPRFQLFYEAEVVTNENETLRKISKREIDFSKTVLVNKELPLTLTAGTGSATLISTNLNSQQFKVSTDKPALFYISDTFFPGWKAYINGSEAEILRANYNLRAIVVPQGNSNVVFQYAPKHFSLGVIISATSLVLLLFVANLQTLILKSKSKQ